MFTERVSDIRDKSYIDNKTQELKPQNLNY